jgi:phospholipase/lecithinase/hemolysin
MHQTQSAVHTARSALPAYLASVALLVTLLAGLARPAAAAPLYSQIFVFGDSLSETGSYLAVGAGDAVYPAPYAPGRFSNGPVWIDYLAGSLGLTVNSAVIPGGTNYAWGGARSGGQPGPFPPYDLGTQTLAFLADLAGQPADADALYVVWGGGNDALAQDVNATASNLGAVIAGLVGAGARNFLLPNLPEVDPYFAQVNADMAPVLETLSADGRLRITRLDVNGLFGFLVQDALAGGTMFGITDFTTPCFDGVNVCADPTAHLWWDAVHPTTRVHGMIGQMAFAELSAVPLPAAVWLLGSAVAVLGGLRARRGG